MPRIPGAQRAWAVIVSEIALAEERCLFRGKSGRFNVFLVEWEMPGLFLLYSSKQFNSESHFLGNGKRWELTCGRRSVSPAGGRRQFGRGTSHPLTLPPSTYLRSQEITRYPTPQQPSLQAVGLRDRNAFIIFIVISFNFILLSLLSRRREDRSPYLLQSKRSTSANVCIS